MISGALVWQQEPITLVRPIAEYGVKLRTALVQLVEYFAARVEAIAKQIAPWNDQTGAARQGLRAFVDATAATITLYLVHSVAYGIWLELGGYPAIQPALQQIYGPLIQAIRRLVGD